VNFGLYVALTDTNVDIIKGQEVQELICGVKIYLAETTGGLTVSSDSALLEVFGQPKHVLVHTGGPEGLERILFFYKKAQNRFGTLPVLYVCHVSTHEELKIVEREKAKGTNLLMRSGLGNNGQRPLAISDTMN